MRSKKAIQSDSKKKRFYLCEPCEVIARGEKCFECKSSKTLQSKVIFDTKMSA